MKAFFKKISPHRWISLSSPVTLGFALLGLIATLLGMLTAGASTRALFSIYRSSLADVLFYPRLFLHVLGHQDFSHYALNMGLFLVLGPLVERHYGAKRYLLMLMLTALITGLFHLLLSPLSAGLGASGLVFMLILLSAASGERPDKKLPLTLVLVALIYLGRELSAALFQNDGISQLAHLIGGLCGMAFGLWQARKGSPA